MIKSSKEKKIFQQTNPCAWGYKNCKHSIHKNPTPSPDGLVEDWEKKLIEKLRRFRIDHTDFDEDCAFNMFCSKEIIRLLDIFKPIINSSLLSAKKEWISEVRKRMSLIPDYKAPLTNIYGEGEQGLWISIKDWEKLKKTL